MEKLKRKFIILGIFFTVLIVLVNGIIGFRQFSLESDMRRIRNLAVKDRLTSRNDPLVQLSAPHDISREEGIALPDANHENEAQPHLTRAPSRGEAWELLTRNEKVKVEFAKTKARLAQAKFIDSISWILGEDDKRYYSDLVQDSLLVGDFSTARRYLWKNVEQYTGDGKESSCSVLSLIEDDPQVCERLLQWSCASDGVSHLIHAIKLCDKVGSEELRDYYVKRLHNVSPEYAKEAMSKFEN